MKTTKKYWKGLAELTNDPAMGIFRHVDAGYPDAKDNARAWDVDIPK